MPNWAKGSLKLRGRSENIVSAGCNEKDVTKLVSQFNNGHLMSVKGLYTNPKELISFVVCDEEDN